MYPRLPLLLWLMTTLILVVSPHLFHLAWWVPLTFAILLIWRYFLTRYQKRLPGNWIQLTIVIFILAGILLSYRTIFGKEAGVALLIALSGLKMLEMNQQRDALLLCFLSYFLIVTNFLHSQTIPTALYMGIVTLVTTATLISLNDHNDSLFIRQRLRLSFKLLMQALPLMMVMFLFFPRISGSFWAVPKDTQRAITGLSDQMSFGNLSELSLSDEIAFRVTFADTIPPSNQRYWRGPVFWWSNGREWKMTTRQYFIEPQRAFQPLGEPYDYTLTLEPHNQTWLFALDLPQRLPSQSKMTADYQILAFLPIQQRIRYDLRSYPEYHANVISMSLYDLALRLPQRKHLRARAMAEQWRREFSTPEQIIQRALQYFKQESFIYTYTPASLEKDTIDEFLFETHQGFCEHYSAAFTVLMRAAGIPTRIVTGYLGGTVNPLGNYLIVRQRDAHAWTEVWLADRGWVRIDPTAAVAPERIEMGIDTALPTDFSSLGLAFQNDSLVVQLWQQLGNGWDALNNSWNQWILGYDKQRQQQLLSRLGLPNLDWQGLVMILFMTVAVLFLTISTWMWLRSRFVTQDPAQDIYHRFCQKLARHGLSRHPYEGPLTFAHRVSAIRPELATSVQEIVELYIKIRYRSQPVYLPQFRQKVRWFRT